MSEIAKHVWTSTPRLPFRLLNHKPPKKPSHPQETVRKELNHDDSTAPHLQIADKNSEPLHRRIALLTSKMLASLSNAFNTVQKKALALQPGPENDGDTVDDTHLCREYRNYYTKVKKAPFPSWLPPDPKNPPPVMYVAPPENNMGDRYGGGGLAQRSGAPTSLDSLFDGVKKGQEQNRPLPPQSLRTPRGPPTANWNQNQYASNKAIPPREEVVAKPLPSSNPNSYQQSARDRFKNKNLGRSANSSPQPSQPSQSRYDLPTSRGGGGDYDPYRSQNNGYGGSSGGEEKAYMGANAPWAGTNSYQAAPKARHGLPSGGPREGRQGLPSGPRG